MAKRYFRKRDPAAQESNLEWIEMSGQEFYRFITSPAGRGCFFIDMEDVVIEAPKEVYEEWRRDSLGRIIIRIRRQRSESRFCL